MDNSDTLKKIAKLTKVIANQQKIINKLAQNANSFPIQNTVKNEGAAIWSALPPAVAANIDRLEVHGTDVKVRFKPGKANDRDFNLIQKVVQDLQGQNTLPGLSYVVKEVV